MKAYITISKDREFLYGAGTTKEEAETSAVEYLEDQDVDTSLEDCMTILAEVEEDSIDAISQDSAYEIA